MTDAADTGGGQHRVLAGAVSEHRVRLDAKVFEQRVQAETRGKHALGGDVHFKQAIFERLAPGVADDRRWREKRRHARIAAATQRVAVDEVETVAHLREVQAERSEESRVGEGGGRTGRAQWWPVK